MFIWEQRPAAKLSTSKLALPLDWFFPAKQHWIAGNLQAIVLVDLSILFLPRTSILKLDLAEMSQSGPIA